MSERDIPTRVMHENGPEGRLPTGPGQMMPPRMQGSKSVPSLNSKILYSFCLLCVTGSFTYLKSGRLKILT